MKQKRAYKYRFYPTDEQKRILAKTFGCVRYVYNWALRERTDAYYQHGERLYYEDTAERLVLLKKQEETSWLNEVSSVPLQQSLRHLDRAFRNFFEGHAQYPAFKKKRNQQAATYASNAFTWNGQALTPAKMDEPLDIRFHRPLPDGCKPSSITLSKDEADRYFISILIEQDIQALEVTPNMVGLDLGIKSMVVTSNGQTHGNPRFFAKEEKKLARAQRKLARAQKGSKNRAKARLKVARLHKKIAERRRDYQHKLSTKIIRENQIVCVESLQVKNMVKNHMLAKAISDVGWGEFVRQLEYKAHWYGRTLVKIDKFYPSSKQCHSCGYLLDSLDLDTRFWVCPKCETAHDRDVNAAQNILAAGLVVNACGEVVRPGAVKAKPGKPRRSRKAS